MKDKDNIKTGRPKLYSDRDRCVINGNVAYIGKQLQNNDFRREKDMSRYVVDNAEQITANIFNDELVSCYENKPIKKQMSLSPSSRRTDIIMKCVKNTYLLELKNPKNVSENRAGIAQLLDYGRQIEEDYNNSIKLVLVTTKFDVDTALTINHYKLPISYYYFNSDQMLEYKGLL
ncbi:MAG: hypothetical protein JKY22_12350 [Flavobacteriaceae bacterium]|nr:hypothetical protein [Flavobacteriaceae bacterium]